MRKKSKKRISQDLQPWRRVVVENEDQLEILGNENSVRWTSGNRRNQQATILSQQSGIEFSKVLFQSFLHDNSNVIASKYLMRTTLALKKHHQHQLTAISRSKNTCFFLGKGSTFNRKLLVSRHTLRKLTRFGLVSGLQQGR